MEKELPKNWERVGFTEIFGINGGTQPPKSQFIHEPKEGYIRLLQIRDFGKKPVPTYIPNNGKLRTCEKDDILIARYGASIGRIVTGEEGAYNVALAKVNIPEVMNKNFVKWLLKSHIFQNKIVSFQRTAQSGFNKDDLSGIKVPLPPLAEQQRIVAKLDELFGHLDSLKTRLNHIPQILKNFRQAVLTQAVTGKLTEEWRVGKKLEEWEEVELETIAKVVDPQPSHRTPPIHEDGIPYVSIKDVNKKGEVILENARPVSKEVLAEHIKRYDLQEGDFGFGKIGTLGKPFLLPMFPERKYTLSANIILIQPRSKGNPKFLYYYLNSSIIEQKLREGTNSTSQPAFGIKKARKFPTPNPSPEEQTEIVKRVEHLFAKADVIETQYQTLKTKIDSLPQAILAKAFKGELVEQLDTDGDAKELLEEIVRLKEKPVNTRKK